MESRAPPRDPSGGRREREPGVAGRDQGRGGLGAARRALPLGPDRLAGFVGPCRRPVDRRRVHAPHLSVAAARRAALGASTQGPGYFHPVRQAVSFRRHRHGHEPVPARERGRGCCPRPLRLARRRRRQRSHRHLAGGGSFARVARAPVHRPPVRGLQLALDATHPCACRARGVAFSGRCRSHRRRMRGSTSLRALASAARAASVALAASGAARRPRAQSRFPGARPPVAAAGSLCSVACDPCLRCGGRRHGRHGGAGSAS